MKSPIPYIGGKSRLAKTIVKMIPDHKAYCEVFAGAAWVFFTKPPSKFETLNDLDNDLVNFYRVLQHHLEEFLKQFKWILTSREFFEDFKAQLETRGLTDIQRAARYYYLQRNAFSSLTLANRQFACGATARPRINLLRIEEDLSAVHLRLTQAKIENLDWREFVERYDKDYTFFYIDPPYWKQRVYRHNMDPSEYCVMADVLGGIKGKFLLSIDDRPETREIFERFAIKPVLLRYSAQKWGANKQGKELLIRNY